jgi:hypothetical protein
MAKKKPTPKPAKPTGKPGPKPEVLSIPGDWENAVKVALNKPKPKGGWPKPRKP